MVLVLKITAICRIFNARAMYDALVVLIASFCFDSTDPAIFPRKIPASLHRWRFPSLSRSRSNVLACFLSLPFILENDKRECTRVQAFPIFLVLPKLMMRIESCRIEDSYLRRRAQLTDG
jgi:hypothetical protein